MREEYEQLELDTRRQLDKAIAQLTEAVSYTHLTLPTIRLV